MWQTYNSDKIITVLLFVGRRQKHNMIYVRYSYIIIYSSKWNFFKFQTFLSLFPFITSLQRHPFSCVQHLYYVITTPFVLSKKFDPGINGARLAPAWVDGKWTLGICALWRVGQKTRWLKCIWRDKNRNVPSSRLQDLTRITGFVYFSNGPGKHIIVDAAWQCVFIW